MNLLAWYIVLSYLVGLLLFFVEINKAIKSEQYHLMRIGIFLLVTAPFTAWHGVLHYLQKWYCKLTKQPEKYWI